MPRGCTCSIGNPPSKTSTTIKQCPVHGDKALTKAENP